MIANESHWRQITQTTFSRVQRNCAILTDGSVWCDFREDQTYREATIIVPFTGASEVAASVNHRCIRKTDDTVWCAEDDLGITTVQVTPLPSIVQIDAGLDQTCGVSSQGYAFCWIARHAGVPPLYPLYFETYMVPGIFDATNVAAGQNAA